MGELCRCSQSQFSACAYNDIQSKPHVCSGSLSNAFAESEANRFLSISIVFLLNTFVLKTCNNNNNLCTFRILLVRLKKNLDQPKGTINNSKKDPLPGVEPGPSPDAFTRCEASLE